MKRLIAELKSARIESMEIDNAFDLNLYQLPNGHYELAVHMKLQFFFNDNHPHRWDSNEEDQFIHEWQNAIHDVWGNKVIHSLPTGNTVMLTFNFHVQKGGWMQHKRVRLVLLHYRVCKYGLFLWQGSPESLFQAGFTT